MIIGQLQQRLIALGHDLGPSGADNRYGSKTRGAVLMAMTDGPDHRLTDSDVRTAALELKVEPAKVWTLHDVESSGSPFIEGRPTILFEPHRFSKATKGRFDRSHPTVSYPRWDRSKYPGSQQARYEQLLTAVGLDVDAGFASASYGGFQILGENYWRCDAASPWDFAWRQAQTEGDQLHAFVKFFQGDAVLLNALRAGDWVTVAKRYNGTAYYLNRYDVRLAQAHRKRLAA